MEDPLTGFNWESLKDRYDEQCRVSGRFVPSASHLSTLANRPESDRELYYILLDRFASERQSGITLVTYQAMLYWKLYSQPFPFTKTGVLCRLEKESNLRHEAQDELSGITGQLPDQLQKDEADVLQAVRSLNEFELVGMKSSDSFPVRTTFFHFIYPEVVPIFDTQVLRAVGVHDKNANHKSAVFREYLSHVWGLALKHSRHCASFSKETVVRVIDMALWVTRGK